MVGVAPAARIDLLPIAPYELNQRRAQSACADLFEVLDTVKDPEIPVLTIWDLGILQDVYRVGAEVHVVLTPTYSGCPAMQTIEEDVRTALQRAGQDDVVVHERLDPAWTTDWLEPETKRRLTAYGIAPPDAAVCPQCGSEDVEVVSEFGSTSCKALLRCRACLEPFDQFKRL